MKLVDKIIRRWRVRVALKYCPSEMHSVFDIGCDDGFLLKQLGQSTVRKEGVDPRLGADTVVDNMKLRRGFFPKAIEKHQIVGPFDVIFALAVFEHFSEEDINASAWAIRGLLASNGRLIATVPHPFVDRILGALLFLRLIDGQALEEHHGFNPDTLIRSFSASLILVKRRRFQLGLNNLLIFERK